MDVVELVLMLLRDRQQLSGAARSRDPRCELARCIKVQSLQRQQQQETESDAWQLVTRAGHCSSCIRNVSRPQVIVPTALPTCGSAVLMSAL